MAFPLGTALPHDWISESYDCPRRQLAFPECKRIAQSMENPPRQTEGKHSTVCTKVHFSLLKFNWLELKSPLSSHTMDFRLGIVIHLCSE